MAELRSEIEGMGRNETREYPLRRRDSVKVTACRVGHLKGRRYSVRTYWGKDIVEVRRVE